MPVGTPHTVFLLLFSVALLAAPASTMGQSAPASSTDTNADSGLSSADPADDDILNMDIDQLSQLSTKVVVSDTNPIVESVSRKAETLAESSGIVEVITAKEIHALGAKTLREVLERGTSIWTPNSAFFPSNILSIRGDLSTHYNTHVLLLLNGRPFKDTLHGGLHHPIFAAFPIESLDRIEIVRGPGSVLYGTNAYVGVINLITKDPLKNPGSLSTLAGSQSTQRYEFAQGGGTEDQSLFVGAMYMDDNGYFRSVVDELDVLNSKNFGQENIGALGIFRRGAFTLQAFAAQADETMLGDSLARGRDDGFLTSTRCFCDAGHTIGDPNGQSLETHFTYNYSDGAFWGVPGQLVPDHLVSHDYLIESIYRAALAENLSLTVGGTVEFLMGHSRLHTVDEYSKTWYSVYAQLDYDVSDRLKLTGGMQGNMPGVIKGGIVPRLGVIVALSDQWTFKTLYGSAFRSPSALETDINVSSIVGNPNLTPETIDTLDVQLAYNDEAKRLAATYFRSNYSDLVARDQLQVPPTYENYGTLEVQGVELEARAKCGKRLQLIGSTSWQDNMNDDGVADATHVPNWMIKFGGIYDTCSGLKIGVFDSYFSQPSSVTLINPGAVIVNPIPDEYHLLSINLRQDLSRFLGWRCRTLEGQFLIQNALDEEIWHPEFSRRHINSVPAQAGRTFYGGFTLTY